MFGKHKQTKTPPASVGGMTDVSLLTSQEEEVHAVLARGSTMGETPIPPRGTGAGARATPICMVSESRRLGMRGCFENKSKSFVFKKCLALSEFKSSCFLDVAKRHKNSFHNVTRRIPHFAYADNASPSRRIYILSIPRNWA